MTWRGRSSRPEQVANARDWIVDLTPASEIPAMQTRANWDAVLPGQPVPLIGEVVTDDCEEDGNCELCW